MADVPQSGGFLMAAYIVAGVIYLGYVLSLWARSRRALKALRREE